MGTVVATWGLTLLAVIVGALASTGTQLYLDRRREQREADRAKQLVAGELLQAQIVLRSVSKGKHWPPMRNPDAYLPTSAWRENRYRLAGKIDETLWDQLVFAYTMLDADRERFVQADQLPPNTPLPAEEAAGISKTARDLGELRQRLFKGGGWLDDLADEFKPRLNTLNDSFKAWLNGLSDDDLRNPAVANKVNEKAKELGDLNRDLGDNGAWLTEINAEIERRLTKVRAPASST